MAIYHRGLYCSVLAMEIHPGFLLPIHSTAKVLWTVRRSLRSAVMHIDPLAKKILVVVSRFSERRPKEAPHKRETKAPAPKPHMELDL